MHHQLVSLYASHLYRDAFAKVLVGHQHDWTTGGPCDGNEWRKYRVVPHAHPCIPVCLLVLKGLEAKGLSDFQRRRGITSVVRWNLRPVIFGVEN